MPSAPPLEYGRYYHIYNRGNNSDVIFSKQEDFKRFLKLFEKFIPPVADTLAWCLMKNHFHFLVRIKDESEIEYLKPLHDISLSEEDKWTMLSNQQLENYNIQELKKPAPSRMLSHLFSSYSMYYNHSHKHSGSIFEKNFHRKNINSTSYLQNLILYIHQNPVHHKVVEDIIEYPWTSYAYYDSNEPSIIQRETGIALFGTLEDFKLLHGKEIGGFEFE
jgi:putative transposase